MSAEERRESIVRVALQEFSTGGYHGTSTERIARQAGISQPYVFRLFPGKKALFLACADLCFNRLTRVLKDGAEGLEGETALEAMGAAYQVLIADQNTLLFQLQLYVASASAEPDVAGPVRRRWMELWELVRIGTGATDEEVNEFFATGMYINTLLALGIGAQSRCWAGLRPVVDG
jgi:AcrR family transcriptional regulator